MSAPQPAKEDSYRQFLELASEGILCVDFAPPIALDQPLRAVVDAIVATGRVVECNAAAAVVRGWQPAELVGKGVDELMDLGDVRNRVVLEQFIGQGCRIVDGVTHGRRADGRDIYFLNNAEGIVRDGCLEQVRVAQRDLTHRIEAEKALELSEERLRIALEAANLGTWRWDIGADQVVWSSESYRVFGLLPGSFGGTLAAFTALVHGDDRSRVQRRIAAAIEGRTERYEDEFRVVAADGRVLWLDGRGRVERDAGGKAVSMAGTVMDITARKHAELELRQSEERFHSLAAAAFECIAITENGAILDVNEQFVDTFGYRREEIVGRAVQMLVHPDDHALVAAMIERGWQGPYEHRAVRKDGSVLIVEVRARAMPLPGRRGRVTSVRDITARKQLDANLLQIAEGVSATTGEAFFRSLVQSLARVLSADFVVLAGGTDSKPGHVRTLAACQRGEIIDNFEYALAGTPCAQVIASDCCVYPTGVRQSFPEDLMLVDLGVDGYVGARLRDRDGATLGLLAVLFQREIAEPDQVESTLRIFAARAAAELARVQAEEHLRLSEARLRATIVNTPNVAVQWYDRHGRVLFWNPASEVIFGFCEAEALGKTLDQLILTAGEAAAFVTTLAEIEATGCTKGPVESAFVRRDGTAGVCVSTIFRIPTGSGHCFVCMDVDITARKKAEARHEELARHLLSAQEKERHRLASELHDSLGQTLSLIKNRVHLARSRCAGEAPVVEQLVAIERLISDSIAEVRSLAHNLRPLQLEQQGVTQALADLLTDVAGSTSIAIDSRLENVDDVLSADQSTHVYRIVQEALHNLVEHSLARRARVELERDVNCVRLRITDDGMGFDPDDPLARRGIGLSSMGERARMLGGTFRVDSAVGRGTSLGFELPIADQGGADAEA
jgi:PAS domain S-box-containing protein